MRDSLHARSPYGLSLARSTLPPDGRGRGRRGDHVGRQPFFYIDAPPQQPPVSREAACWRQGPRVPHPIGPDRVR